MSNDKDGYYVEEEGNFGDRRRRWISTKSEETPGEKAKRIGVPLIPKRDIPIKPYESDPTVAVCGECGLEIKKIMGYYCSKANCPAGLGGNSSFGEFC